MKRLIVAAAVAAFVAACGSTNDGRVAMEVSVAGLTDAQHFCFTWQIYQLDEEGSWVLIDQVTEPVCGQDGSDKLSSVGTCYGDRRFLVSYEVKFYDGEGQIGSALGTSGGSEEDVCEMNHDTPSYALFQFGNTGNVGGVNPGIEIDQVCTNDKLEVEGEALISALWMQPDTCDPQDVPDTYCVLGMGSGIETIRYGVTLDGKVRYLFNQSGLEGNWALYFLSFQPDFAADTLVLQHNPWVLSHSLSGTDIGRGPVDAQVAYRYNDSLGFVLYDESGLTVFSDQSADCNGPISLDADSAEVALPECGTAPVFMGAVPAGGALFELVFRCDTNVYFIGCDALSEGAICELPAE